MACYRSGGCGPYEMYSCNECPASKPEYLNRNKVESGWIKVNGRLPIPYKQRVLVVLTDGSVQFATDWVDWDDGHVSFYIPIYERWLEGTHWMHLPEPPKED